MKVLMTGSEGKIGSVLKEILRECGHEVVCFDLAFNQNLLNLSQLEEAIQGCEWLVHLAANLGEEDDNEVLNVNVGGTWNLLKAAVQNRVERFVFTISVEVLGVFRGERAPDYLPLDDFSPCYPTTAYAMSKRLGEEMCRLWTKTGGMTTVCLRLPGVFAASDYEFIVQKRREHPEFEWSPFWQYGAFLDVKDAATSLERALVCPFNGHETLLLCAEDISSAALPTLELIRHLCPDVEWRGAHEYETMPFRSLLNTTHAQQVLGWKPLYKWRPNS